MRHEDEDWQSTVKADLAQEHRFLQADHRTSRRAGRSHAVVRVPSLSSKHREEAEQLVVRGARRPVRLDEPDQCLGSTGQCGPKRVEGVSGPRPGGWCVRAPHVFTEALGKSVNWEVIVLCRCC